MFRFAFALLVLSSAAIAGPASRSGMSLDGFVKSVARESGLDADQVREHIVEVLREEREISMADLMRIGRGETIKTGLEETVVSLLVENQEFHVVVGLRGSRIRKIVDDAGAAFEAMKVTDVAGIPVSPPLEAWRHLDIAKHDLRELLFENVLVDLGHGPVYAKVLKVPAVRSQEGIRQGSIELVLDGDMIVGIGEKKYKVAGRNMHGFETDVLVRPNTFRIDNTVPDGLLSVGDVFTSKSIADALELKSKKSFEGARWIVEATELSGGGGGHMETYPDGWGLHVRKLKADGSYDAEGVTGFVRQSGSFRNLIDDAKLVAHMGKNGVIGKKKNATRKSSKKSSW